MNVQLTLVNVYLQLLRDEKAPKKQKLCLLMRITGITVLPDQVIIDWLKGQMHGVLVETSYDGANWEKLDKDNRSPYEDTRKNQVHQQAKTRHYCLRYIYKDQLVGHYSDVVKTKVAIY